MKTLKYSLYTLLASMATVSCTAMHDDLDECPYGLYVRFVYDYNTVRADMFPDHVGHLRLHVYDEDGKKVAERVVSNSELEKPLDIHGFTVYFPNSELAPGHSYRLQAVAMQKDWDEALATDGAKYRREEGSAPHEHRIHLDHAPATDGTDLHDVSNAAPLDTLWHTLKVTATEPLSTQDDPGIVRTKAPYTLYPLGDQMVKVEKERYTYATVSMMRDTKHLNITLRQLDDPVNVHHDDYELTILDDNAHLDGNNELIPQQTVRYTPYASWTTRFDSDGNVDVETRTDDSETGEPNVVQRTAHYNIMFNRTMMPEGNDPGSRLVLKNKTTGNIVADISLPKILAQGRTAYEFYNYQPQEYLDREHDYHLDFILKGDEWQYVEIKINVLSWAHRIYNVVLGE